MVFFLSFFQFKNNYNLYHKQIRKKIFCANNIFVFKFSVFLIAFYIERNIDQNIQIKKQKLNHTIKRHTLCAMFIVAIKS